jgi:signal transduction histidine kinase
MAITVEALLKSVLSIYQGRVSNSPVRICERHRALQPIRCFEGEIRQVLSNLVNNAFDAMNSAGGNLYLRTRLGHNWKNGDPGIVITVADTGAGMDPQTLARVFDPFFTTKGITGTGLGLWVSREIVNRHRGQLRVRSSNSPQCHGTVFNLFLPFDAVLR